MILKNYLTIAFVFTGLIAVSQNQVCSSSTDDITDLHSIGKCAIENFKKSNTREFIKVSTRNRYVRKKSANHHTNLRKSLKVVANATKAIETGSKGITTANRKVLSENVNSANSKEVLIKNFLRFDEVSEMPVFITCENSSNSIKQNCIKETIVGNILENLIYPFDAASEGIQGTVWVRFIIDEDGYVKNITTTGPENGVLLEKEAERLVKLLPKFLPGKHDNKYVNVEYFMPIDFQLEE